MRRIALLFALVGCGAQTTRMRAYVYANDTARPTAALGLATAVGEGIAVAIDDCFGRTLPPGGTCTVTVRLADDQATGMLTIGDRTEPVAATEH
jgi:type 1 fimbria pilin